MAKVVAAAGGVALAGLAAWKLRKSAAKGEAFRLHLDGYFVENQMGQTVNLLLEFGYRGVLPLTQMPDYRLIQLLVEEVLYVYEPSWIDIFWCPRPRLEPAASGRLTSAHAPAAAGR